MLRVRHPIERLAENDDPVIGSAMIRLGRIVDRTAGGMPILTLPPIVRILLAREPAALRKGFDGLSLVSSVMSRPMRLPGTIAPVPGRI
jgi:hypothetical protein